MPLARRRGRLRLPHSPLRPGAPAEEGAAGADPGRPRPGPPQPPAPIDPDLPSADIRIGYARCSTLGQELDSQLDALAGHGIPRDKIFAEKISTRIRVRPTFEEALRTAREVKAHAPHCRVIFTVYEMKRLGRDAAELTALADHLTAHGLILEMLAGPLPGIYDPTGPGKLLFAFFAAMAETERENIRESTLEGLDTAARKGKHGGRPPVITDDMLHTVLRRRANGESVEQIQPLHGVRGVLFYYGTNDLTAGCDAAQIIGSYRETFARLHAAGIKVYVTPITPRPGYSDTANRERHTVAGFVRKGSDCSGTCDGVLDFDQVLKDPVKPNSIAPAYDTGDGVHVNVAGQQALADFVSLPMVTGQTH
ncbi:recombinase family protein [Streptomyces sp. NPDC087894]|uniref:recombinase family protein n=1 Tax=Streptomyces sp. NPDC087894 TaxID=3365816 RepID=UPI00380F5DD0